MSEYNQNIEPMKLVAVIIEIGKVVRWPMNLPHVKAKRDTTKWCEYHGDHDHVTADCIALYLEIVKLLKKGHLHDFLTDKGKNTLENKDHQITPQKKAQPANGLCNVISGGSEVSSVSYSLAKCHAKAVADPKVQSSGPHLQKATDLTIEFIDNEMVMLLNPHHDALVITLHIANFLVKRILVDPSSFAKSYSSRHSKS
ncbi:uncharacterized protein LOC116118876 [Pistacia vera]|uniref:uncharacterized protein LOC116118876 n=1 Tax=Pistacia vera TaxID=55513 RepID=UPI001262FF6C|nr:uncharacterized protein LOC116118876 [Pistacia vera]